MLGWRWFAICCWFVGWLVIYVCLRFGCGYLTALVLAIQVGVLF